MAVIKEHVLWIRESLNFHHHPEIAGLCPHYLRVTFKLKPSWNMWSRFTCQLVPQREGMPSGPVRLLINSVSECHHLMFPTRAALTVFTNKLTLLSNFFPCASDTIWIQMLIPSCRMYFWGLSLLLAFPSWCNPDKAYDTILKSAYEGSKQTPVIAIRWCRQDSSSALEASPMEGCSSQPKKNVRKAVWGSVSRTWL